MRVEDRFQAKVMKTESCWEWLATHNGRGYGLFRVDGTYQLAHRVSYTLYKGAIPQGLLVRHTCDNPNCVNPDHLEVGTNYDNRQDMMKRGRCPSSKLTPEQVKEIREILKSNHGRTLKDIGSQFGVSRQVISRIGTGEAYSHLLE